MSCQFKMYYMSINNLVLGSTNDLNRLVLEVFYKSELHEIPLTFAVVAAVTPNKKNTTIRV